MVWKLSHILADNDLCNSLISDQAVFFQLLLSSFSWNRVLNLAMYAFKGNLALTKI